MAMRNAMTKEQALDHAKKLAVAFGKFGAQIKVPYTVPQLLEVIAVLHANGNWEAPTTEELTKVKRQLTACQAREAGLRKKISGAQNEDDAAELKAEDKQHVQDMYDDLVGGDIEG